MFSFSFTLFSIFRVHVFCKFFHHSLTVHLYLMQAADRFQTVYPIIKELALAGLQNSKTTRPVAQQLLPLSVAALSQGRRSSCFYDMLPPECKL